MLKSSLLNRVAGYNALWSLYLEASVLLCCMFDLYNMLTSSLLKRVTGSLRIVKLVLKGQRAAPLHAPPKKHVKK
jgi:hypothetical protein